MGTWTSWFQPADVVLTLGSPGGTTAGFSRNSSAITGTYQGTHPGNAIAGAPDWFEALVETGTKPPPAGGTIAHTHPYINGYGTTNGDRSQYSTVSVAYSGLSTGFDGAYFANNTAGQPYGRFEYSVGTDTIRLLPLHFLHDHLRPDVVLADPSLPVSYSDYEWENPLYADLGSWGAGTPPYGYQLGGVAPGGAFTAATITFTPQAPSVPYSSGPTFQADLYRWPYNESLYPTSHSALWHTEGSLRHSWEIQNPGIASGSYVDNFLSLFPSGMQSYATAQDASDAMLPYNIFYTIVHNAAASGSANWITNSSVPTNSQKGLWSFPTATVTITPSRVRFFVDNAPNIGYVGQSQRAEFRHDLITSRAYGVTGYGYNPGVG
jgi:hypothetical protein